MLPPSPNPSPVRSPQTLAHAAWLIATALCAAGTQPAQAGRELFAQADTTAAQQAIEAAATPEEKPASKTKQATPPPPAEPAPESGPAELMGGQAGASSPSFNVTINLIKRILKRI